MCSVFHGGQRLSVDISSEPKQMSTDGFPGTGTVVWDNWYVLLFLTMSTDGFSGTVVWEDWYVLLFLTTWAFAILVLSLS